MGDEAPFEKHLFIPNKLGYLRGTERPNVPCILCAVLAREPSVTNLLVHETERFAVSANLYPYSPGHVFVFPRAHLLDYRLIDDEAALELHRLLKRTLDILDREYRPHGYNLGWNLGRAAGASIEHLHIHVVPRFATEVGFLDIVGGTRIIVEDPRRTVERLRDAFRATATS
jgi:ATP adenylyltransferase